MKSSAAQNNPNTIGVAITAWLVPGAGHAMQGRFRKAGIFFAVLVLMFVIGISSGGRLFPFQLNDPLVFLAAIAECGLGIPRIVAALGGMGQGEVTAAAYEYGNTFLIAAGLLNALVVFDAVDIAAGRKAE